VVPFTLGVMVMFPTLSPGTLPVKFSV
jgi:hypothetical protein